MIGDEKEIFYYGTYNLLRYNYNQCIGHWCYIGHTNLHLNKIKSNNNRKTEMVKMSKVDNGCPINYLSIMISVFTIIFSFCLILQDKMLFVAMLPILILMNMCALAIYSDGLQN